MTLLKNQRGFSPLIVILIVVVLAGLGGAGYYVWNKNKDDNKKDNTSQNSKDEGEEDPQDEKPEIPDGFTVYDNSELGFSFAYPEEVGPLNPAEGGDSQLYVKSDDTRDAFAPHTQSPLYVASKNEEGFLTSGGKYGPTLEYQAGKWIVSAKGNGAVLTGGYEIGSEFNAPIARTVSGILVYDFSYTDEGCYHKTWVFPLKESFVSIQLPVVCADEIDIIPEQRLATYKEVSTKVLKTLSINQ